MNSFLHLLFHVGLQTQAWRVTAQASSGNHERHRLNRHGDKLLNKALDVVARTRMGHDDETKRYVEKRKAEGLSPKEIKRILKRYIARSIYRQLQVIMA